MANELKLHRRRLRIAARVAVIALLTIGLVGYSGGAVSHGRVGLPTEKGDLEALTRATGAVVWRQRTGKSEALQVEYGRRGVLIAYEFRCTGGGYVGPLEAFVAAFDADSGELRWRAPSEVLASEATNSGAGSIALMASSLGAGSDIVVTVSGGVLEGRDLKTGHTRWETSAAGLVPADGSPKVVLLSQYGNEPRSVVRAVERETGNPLWVYEAAPGERIYDMYTTDATTIVRLISGFGPSSTSLTVALDTKTGDQRWQVVNEEPFRTGSMQLVGSVLVVSGIGDEVARGYDALTGRPLWSTSLVEYSIPRVIDAARGIAVVLSTSDEQELIGLDITTGAIRWAIRSPGEQYFIGQDLITVTDYRFRRDATLVSGKLHAFSASSGEPIWTRHIPPTLRFTAEAGSHLYLSGGCLRPSD